MGVQKIVKLRIIFIAKMNQANVNVKRAIKRIKKENVLKRQFH